MGVYIKGISIDERTNCIFKGYDDCVLTHKKCKRFGGREEECPVVDMEEPKTGEWMRLEREENVYDLHGVPTWGVNYMCDKCGFITTAIQDHFGQYKWCPSCGADMRGDKNG